MAAQEAAVAIDEHRAEIQTGEREQFWAYLDAVRTAMGVDDAALTSRRDLRRDELTDLWRE